MQRKLTEVIHFYLPHGVKCEVTDQGKKVVAELCGVYSDNSYAFFDTVESEHGYYGIKPILKPLSVLTDNESYLCQWFEMKHQQKITYSKDKKSIMIFNYDGWEYHCNYETLPYYVFDYLISNNLDLFGLIESGQAVEG